MHRRGWVIFDRKRQYICVYYKTEQEAAREMEDLLRYYPPDHEWRKRLHVEFVEDMPLVLPGEPPYGYRHVEDRRHGRRVDTDSGEQKVLRTIYRLHDSGLPVRQLTARLATLHLQPRHGYAFTVEQVQQLVEERRRDGQEEGAASRPAGEAPAGRGCGEDQKLQRRGSRHPPGVPRQGHEALVL